MALGEPRREGGLLGVEGALDVVSQLGQRAAHAVATGPLPYPDPWPVRGGEEHVEALDVGTNRAQMGLCTGRVVRGALHGGDLALQRRAADEDRQRRIAGVQPGDGLRQEQRLGLGVGQAGAHAGRTLEVARRARRLLVGANEQHLAEHEDGDERHAEDGQQPAPAGRSAGLRVRRGGRRGHRDPVIGPSPTMLSPSVLAV